MKTLCFVMICAIVSVFFVRADEGIGEEIVVVGMDETLMTVPEPVADQSLDLPFIEPYRPASPNPAAILPPIGDWPRPLDEQFPPALLQVPLSALIMH
jgi:hypothetical protein